MKKVVVEARQKSLVRSMCWEYSSLVELMLNMQEEALVSIPSRHTLLYRYIDYKCHYCYDLCIFHSLCFLPNTWRSVCNSIVS
jgi:hypothetical protein